MRADALSQWLEKLHGDKVVLQRWQALEESSALDRFGVRLYNQIQRRWPLAHHLYFNFLEYLGLHRLALGIRGKKRWREKARKFRPDVVVSTHAHLNHGYFSMLRDALAPNPPRCLIYCGELHGGYGFSRHWINPKADTFIAATPASADAAYYAGMPRERIHKGGFLLKPIFYEQENSNIPLEELVVERLKSPIVLLGTGANGANNHADILEYLGGLETPVSFLALCGRNQEAYDRLKRLDIAPHRVIPLGYQEEMPTLLRRVDLAFIRPGSGTTSECVHCHCPLLFNGIGGIMPQEGVTLRGVREMGLPTLVVKRATRFGTVLAELLDPCRHELERQKEVFASLQADGGPEEIVREILR